MSVELRLNRSAVQELARKESTRILLQAQRRVLNAATTRSPWKTGALSTSHQAGPIRVSNRGAQADVVAVQSYAAAVHEGSRPHVIRPRRAKVLAWKRQKGMVFARSVNHPGTKPRPWLLNALRAEGPAMGFEVNA